MIHPSETEVLVRGSKYNTVSWITSEEIWPKPQNWNAKDYCVKAVSKSLIKDVGEGDNIDLGDKKIEILHLPGHTQVCIVNSLGNL